MAISCGINVNLNNLQGEIATQLNGFVNLSGALGTRAGLNSVQALLGPALTSITTQFNKLIPAVPTIPQSLRNDLASLVALPAGSPSALAGIAQFVQDYTGLQDIDAFVNLNLNDLAASVFSVTGTFDPCAKSFSIPSVPSLPNIPNIIKNPVTGALEELPAIQPELGSTTIAKATKVIEEVANNFDAATLENEVMDAKDTVEKSLTNLKNNIQPAVDDALRRLPSGEEVLEMQSDLIGRLKEQAEMLKDVPLTIPKVPDPGSFLGTKPTGITI